jgi:hypothetical protein
MPVPAMIRVRAVVRRGPALGLFPLESLQERAESRSLFHDRVSHVDLLGGLTGPRRGSR